ncbi:hypothetical protein L195_g062955, partial [Trifolium pratense]
MEMEEEYFQKRKMGTGMWNLLDSGTMS